MPEGHTLHRLARAWRAFVGRRVATTSPQGRFADGAAAIDGCVLEGVDAYGKHLLFDFGDVHLHVHLGMAGAMFEADPAGTPSPGVRLRMIPEGGRAWDLVAPIRCELLTPGDRAALLARLGPDPLRGDDPAPALERIRRSNKPIGALLLDQRVLAGVGNVLRAEALHACRIHPERPGSSLDPTDLRCLWQTLRAMMERATGEGRIITIETAEGVDRASIEQGEGRYVYKQERCRTCGEPVRAWPLASRSAYACERCQPPP